jgi:hypothetical protein
MVACRYTAAAAAVAAIVVDPVAAAVAAAATCAQAAQIVPLRKPYTAARSLQTQANVKPAEPHSTQHPNVTVSICGDNVGMWLNMPQLNCQYVRDSVQISLCLLNDVHKPVASIMEGYC